MKKRGGKAIRQEDLLLDYVRQSSSYRKGRRAVHVKVSGLQRHYQQQSWLIEAARSWLLFNQKAMGELYKLANNDYFAVFPETSAAEVDRAILGLMRVFRDDPTVQRSEQGDPNAFVERFDLAKEYDALLERVEAIAAGAPVPVAAAAAPKAAVSSAARPAEPAAPPPVRAVLPPATIEDLPSLLRAIAKEDPPAVLTRRTTHILQGDASPRSAMVEIRADMLRILAQLRATELAGKNPWVERILRDKCYELGLKGIAASWPEGKDVIVVPVSLASVRTGAFDAFSRRAVGHEQRILLRFSYEECLIDLAAFNNMADGIKGRGFGIMVGGISPAVFAMLNLAPLNAKFLRMEWPENDQTHLTPAMAASLAARLQTMDRTRIVLAGCSSASAMEFGKALGISLFEGSFVSE